MKRADRESSCVWKLKSEKVYFQIWWIKKFPIILVNIFKKMKTKSRISFEILSLLYSVNQIKNHTLNENGKSRFPHKFSTLIFR